MLPQSPTRAGILAPALGFREHCAPGRSEPDSSKNCVACHNPSVKSGDVDLKSLQTAKTFDENREVWEKVVDKLKTGQMPPPGVPRPPEARHHCSHALAGNASSTGWTDR